MVSISGIGWITAGECGCIGRNEQSPFDDDGGLEGLSRKGLFVRPFKNFGRLDRVSRMTAAAVALALKDAGVSHSPEQKLDIGVIGTSGSGSLSTDLLYFKDYVECGRTLGRGNLFIYTLPSSPLGEAAIHFGLQGPLLYAADGKASLSTVLETAGEMVLLGEAGAMLAGAADEQEALYVVLARGNGDRGRALDTIHEARVIADKGLSVADTIQEFRAVKGKKVRS